MQDDKCVACADQFKHGETCYIDQLLTCEDGWYFEDDVCKECEPDFPGSLVCNS